MKIAGRYVSAGMAGAVVNLLSFKIFIALGWWYIGSSVLSFLLSMLVSFLLQKLWTFKRRDWLEAHKEGMSYFLISLLSLLLNVAGLHFAVESLGQPVFLAQIVIVILVGLLSFILNHQVTFKQSDL